MNRKSRHPAYIVSESKSDYDSMLITHSPYRSKSKRNEPFSINPNPHDKRQSYFEKRKRTYPKYVYGSILEDWKLSPKDKRKIEKILSKYDK
jgi:hypothetical protein